MKGENVSRRTYIKGVTAGSLAAISGLAGCMSDGGGTTGESGQQTLTLQSRGVGPR